MTMAAPRKKQSSMIKDANGRIVDLVAPDWFGRVVAAPEVRVTTPDGETHHVGADRPEA
ncbi:hypothetical protein [Embleya scabrispora]|uniref:hypothetical protein n=1 Tax=Embleya scabrispora TaxID=159449 RepID=UPI001374BA10|nr:hypothetical protein [Embleya scabrispora]